MSQAAGGSRYELLRKLYLGSAANADITARWARELFHIRTPLDTLIPQLLSGARDLVLTGNPGDGKSHLARSLQEAGALDGAVVELDLSARDGALVAADWAQARAAGKRFVLCGNEGPLQQLLPRLLQDQALVASAAELEGQLGRLIHAGSEGLPPEPSEVYLIDLADRNVADGELIERCLERVCTFDFLPQLGELSPQSCVPGQNLTLLAQCPLGRARLAVVLEHAAQRCGAHITFRDLWSAIAFSLTGGQGLTQLKRSARGAPLGLGTLPLDLLARPRAQGRLIQAVRELADPGQVSVPGLDEELWTRGEPRRGEWQFDQIERTRPAELWAEGRRGEALEALRQLRRLVLLAHEAGERLLEALERSDAYLPSKLGDDRLLRTATRGLSGLFLSPRERASAPQWLVEQVPLWVSHTYRELPRVERPHVACDSVDGSELQVLRPAQVPWLKGALGSLPEVAWLAHPASGITLTLTPSLLRSLEVACSAAGPVPLPEVAGRFLERLAGWRERVPEDRLGSDQFAVLERPRGELVSTGLVTTMADGSEAYA